MTPKQRALAAVCAVAFVGGATWLAGRGRPPAPAAIGPLPPASVASAAEPDGGPDAPPEAVALSIDGGSGACAALEAANRAVLATVDGGACTPAVPELGCATTRTGVTWGCEILSSKTADENANAPDGGDWSDMQCSSEAEVQLVRIDAKGAKTFGARETLRHTWYHTEALACARGPRSSRRSRRPSR